MANRSVPTSPSILQPAISINASHPSLLHLLHGALAPNPIVEPESSYQIFVCTPEKWVPGVLFIGSWLFSNSCHSKENYFSSVLLPQPLSHCLVGKENAEIPDSWFQK